jgi:hypothetical protein
LLLHPPGWKSLGSTPHSIVLNRMTHRNQDVIFYLNVELT